MAITSVSENFSPKSALITTLEIRADKQRRQSDERAQAHRLAAGFWGVVHRGLTAIAAIASAVAGASLLTSATGGWRITAGILALMAATFSAADTTLKAGELAENHKRGFDGFTQMRTKWAHYEYVTLGLPQADRRRAEEFRQLVSERDQLAERVPAPPLWAIKRAGKILKKENVPNQVSIPLIDDDSEDWIL